MQHLVNTELTAGFFYTDLAGAPITGAAGDFDLKIFKSSAAYSTTGLSLLELGSGHYAVQAVSSSFVSEEGQYYLTLTHSTDALAKYDFDVQVAPGQTYQANAASFTATVGDGRVTDGTNPIDNATVYIKVGGEIITQTETDSDGLWGPVYGLTQTATIFAQKSGYAQQTGTITVSGTTATGPGTDLELSTVTGSDFLVSNLVAYCRRMIGDRTGSRDTTVILQAINQAQNMLVSDCMSPWHLDTYDLAVSGRYTTGTLSATNGDATVTISGGTMPSWIADNALVLDGRVYWVASRTSDTEIELKAKYVGETGSKTQWQMIAYSYSMPENMMQTRDVFDGRSYIRMAGTSFEQIMSYIYRRPSGDAENRYYAVGDGRIIFSKAWGSDDFVTIVYKRRPTQVVNVSETADLDPMMKDAMYRAMDYQLCLRYESLQDGREVHGCIKAYTAAVKIYNFNNREGFDQETPNKGRNADGWNNGGLGYGTNYLGD